MSLGNPLAAALAGCVVLLDLAHMAPGWWGGWAALVLWTLAYALDCADGQLARLTGKTSEYGARVDVIADYVAQALLVSSVAVVIAHSSHVPLVFVTLTCCVWFFGTFAAVLRRSDTVEGHKLLAQSRLGVGLVLRTLLDTALINLVLGTWMVVSPTTVVVPGLGFGLLNATYIAASLLREVKSSLQSSKP